MDDDGGSKYSNNHTLPRDSLLYNAWLKEGGTSISMSST